MNQQERQDYQRYKEYVQEGYTDFSAAVEWFENGMSRRKPHYQEKLRNILMELKSRGWDNDEISERVGLSYNQVTNIIHNYSNAISKERAELAIKELTS